MKDFRFSKKWLLIIFISSISAILVSSNVIPVLADRPPHDADPGPDPSDAHHDAWDLNGDHRAILLKFSGNAGSSVWMYDSLNNGVHPHYRNYTNPDPTNKLENFMESNAGTHHDSAWNQFHYPDDGSNWDFNSALSPPDNVANCHPCNWLQAKADALAYINSNPQKKIVLAGFSFGGGAATFLADDLQHIRQVEGVFLTDPVGPGIGGASRAAISQKCNIGLDVPVDGICYATNPSRTMNSNIKVIFVAYQRDDPGIPPDAGTHNLEGWGNHIAGSFAADGVFDCDVTGWGSCHGQIGYQAPLQPNFIGHLNLYHNQKPTIELVGANQYHVFPGESLEIVTRSEDPWAIGEVVGDMRLFPRLDSLNNGIEPFSLIENGSFESGTSFGNWDEQSGQFVTLGVGDTNLKFWEITSGTVDHVYRLWIAPDGSKSLDMSGSAGTSPANTISQTFDTIEGETEYSVIFYASANPLCSDREMGLNVQAGDSPLEHFIVGNANKAPAFMNWNPMYYPFKASGPTATLQFTSTDTSGCGVTLDNVSVTKAATVFSYTIVKLNFIEKYATFVIKIPDDAVPGTTIERTVWVEDNGWPCDNCTSTDDSIDGGATGKWNSASFAIHILDPDVPFMSDPLPPFEKPPIGKPKLPDEKPPIGKPKLPDEKPPIGKPKLPDEKPPIADPPPPDGKFKPSELSIPQWVKNTAGWWSDNAVDDSDFTGGISYLIEEDVIHIPDLPAATEATQEKVPEWVRNLAGWWSDDLTTDKEFADAIKYLVEQGIIQVKT